MLKDDGECERQMWEVTDVKVRDDCGGLDESPDSEGKMYLLYHDAETTAEHDRTLLSQ